MTYVTTSNIDYLISPLRIHLGDVDQTTFTDQVLLTSLVYGVRWLQNKWGNRYFVYTSGMLISDTTVNTPDGNCTLGYLPAENDIFRNCRASFVSSNPVIDQNDEMPIILAGAILARRAAMSSSATAFTNWSTPDLSVSNVQSSKALLDLLKADMDMLESYFKGKLGRAQKNAFIEALTGPQFARYHINIPGENVIRD